MDNELPPFSCQPIIDLNSNKFNNNSEKYRYLYNNKILNKLKMSLI